MHMETGHSNCQSQPTHVKDLHCPFCLYQTKNKNNMIDHIVLHRGRSDARQVFRVSDVFFLSCLHFVFLLFPEERVVPIEVRRPKLSRYLQGIVFRCHKCTFTSGSDENLRLHMTRHDDIKPYKCRLCYFDCTRLSDLEEHLSDKHQVRMFLSVLLCIIRIPLCSKILAFFEKGKRANCLCCETDLCCQMTNSSRNRENEDSEKLFPCFISK